MQLTAEIVTTTRVVYEARNEDIEYTSFYYQVRLLKIKCTKMNPKFPENMILLKRKIQNQSKAVALDLNSLQPQVNQQQMAFSSDSYNKFANKNQGILVGNWFEERVLREMTGYGRHATKSHKPKKRGSIDEIKSSKYGSVLPFKPREIGRRTELLQKQIQNEILKEQEELEFQMKKKSEERFLTTTKQVDFVTKPFSQQIGRRIMKTQDGNTAQSDTDFLVEQGIIQPKPRRNIEQLRSEVVVKDYLTDIPITHHSHRLADGAVITSKCKGTNPFARSNAFTQPIQNTKGAKGYQGNI